METRMCRKLIVTFINLAVISVASTGEVCYTDYNVRNVALEKPTNSSSEIGPRSHSVDGKQLMNGGCFYSARENDPWLAVDLLEETAISTVVILSQDIEDLPIQILVGAEFNALTSGFTQCGGIYDNIRTGTLFFIHCYQTLVGRYLIVQMGATDSVLKVCELEIYPEQVFQHEQWTCIFPGLEGPQGSLNVARNKQTNQSSTYGNDYSNLAVDGNDNPNLNMYGSCSQTDKTGRPEWFVVDLGKQEVVVGVALVNRDRQSERLRHFSIHVGANVGPITQFDSSDYEVCAKMCHEQIDRKKYYSCKDKIDGQNVAVAFNDPSLGHLTICEIEVYTAAVEDISFPTLESGLKWVPSHQNLLFDNDETTCVAVGEDFNTDMQPLSLIASWDPNEKNSPLDAVATYYCQTEFFVNVTHGTSVDIQALIGNDIVTKENVSGKLLRYEFCPLIGRTSLHGFVMTKFVCQCQVKCNVRIKISLKDENEPLDDRLCMLKVYD